MYSKLVIAVGFAKALFFISNIYIHNANWVIWVISNFPTRQKHRVSTSAEKQIPLGTTSPKALPKPSHTRTYRPNINQHQKT